MCQDALSCGRDEQLIDNFCYRRLLLELRSKRRSGKLPQRTAHRCWPLAKLTKFEKRSKGKVKDKAQHAVILDKTTSEKLNKDVQSYRLVTVATLVDRLKINGSLARQCIADLEEKGIIKPVVTHSKMKIYSMRLPMNEPRLVLANE